MKIIIPKTLQNGDQELTFFLLGPIKGGGDWQYQCCLELNKKLQQPFYVAVPCLWTPEHPLYSYRIRGDENHFQRQLEWERFHLVGAARFGCIIVWLPCEDKQNPRTDGQPYARDSYGEIGEWRGRLMYDRTTRFVIGAQEGFPGLDVISRNFKWAISESFKIYSTLEDTVMEAIKKSGAR
jgi:hypothetical protein